MGNFLSSYNKNEDIENKIAISLQKKLKNRNIFNNIPFEDDFNSISDNDTLYWNTEEYDGRYLDVSLEELGKLYLQGELPCNQKNETSYQKNDLTINDIIIAYKSNPFVRVQDDDIFIQTDKNKLSDKKNCSGMTLFGGNDNNQDSSDLNTLKFASDDKINSPTSSDNAYLQYKKLKKNINGGGKNQNQNPIGGGEKIQKQNPIGGNSNNTSLKNKIYNTNDVFSKHINNDIFSKHLNVDAKKNNKNNKNSMSHSELSDLKKFIRNQQNNISESSVNSNTVSTIEHLLKSTMTDNSDESSQSNQNGGNKIPFYSTESVDVSYGY